MKSLPLDLTRRDLLAAGVALGLARCAPEESASPASTPANLADPLHFSSVAGLASAIQKKTVSSEEVVRAFLDRIDAVNG